MFNMLTDTREAVKVLNNEAVYLSNQCCDYIQAIEYFQRALIIGKQTESSHSNSHAFNPKTLLEIEFCATNGKPPLEKRGFFFSREIEPDEGLYSYTKTLAIALREAPSDNQRQEDTTLNGIIFHGFEAVLCFNLGVCYLLSDQDQEATLYFSRTEALLETQGSIYNSSSEILVQGVSNNEDTVTPFRLDNIAVLHNIGLINFRAGRYEKSLQCYIEAVAKSIAKYEAEDISVALALNTIGVILSRTAQGPSSSFDSTESTYEDAIAALNRSLNIRINILGEDAGSDKDTGTVLNNIGRIHFLLNDVEEALKYHDEAHTVRKLALGEDHVDTGVAAFNIGQCYQALKKPYDAFNHYSIFVKSIFKSINLQSLNENTVRAFEHIAMCFHEDKYPDYAIPFYELALQSAKRIFGENDAYVAQILNRRGNLFCELCAWEDSLESYKAGLEIECAVYSCNHPNIATTEENIARVLHERAQ